MTLLISYISVGQAATVLNVLVAFLRYTLSLALVALLVYSVPPVNSAVAWNVIARRLHGSLWPTLLPTDTLRGTGFQVMFFSYISLLSTILIVVAGVVMPLGLSNGPARQTSLRSVPVTFVADTSPMGLATSPRTVYKAPSACSFGATTMEIRVGSTNRVVVSVKLNSFTSGKNYSMTIPQYSMTESIILRKGIFAYNLTDRGGFFDLTRDYPELNRNGQQLDLWQHAWKGVVLSNFFSMQALNNLTRNESYSGRSFALNSSQTNIMAAGKMQTVPLPVVQDPSNLDVGADLTTSCRGYGGTDTANITNVGVSCRMFLAPPHRTDGGDPLIPGDNSTWSQRVYGCASATRARMQRVQFSFNGSMDLDALSITRRDIDTPVLWAIEKTDINITDVDLFWGQIPDSLEGDTSLSTIRSDVFYVPAGGADIWGVATGGTPSLMPALAWTTVMNALSTTGSSGFPDYSGTSNFALQQKYQLLMLADPTNGAAMIQNLVWTDLMANNVLGSETRQTLLVGENVPTIAYDLRYAIPALLLLLLWVPSLAGALFVLVMPGMLKVSYLRHLIDHTAAGRIAVGDSALRPMNAASPGHFALSLSQNLCISLALLTFLKSQSKLGNLMAALTADFQAPRARTMPLPLASRLHADATSTTTAADIPSPLPLLFVPHVLPHARSSQERDRARRILATPMPAPACTYRTHHEAPACDFDGLHKRRHRVQGGSDKRAGCGTVAAGTHLQARASPRPHPRRDTGRRHQDDVRGERMSGAHWCRRSEASEFGARAQNLHPTRTALRMNWDLFVDDSAFEGRKSSSDTASQSANNVTFWRPCQSREPGEIRKRQKRAYAMWKERKLRKKKYHLDWNHEYKESPAPLACGGGRCKTKETASDSKTMAQVTVQVTVALQSASDT
ncbi:hypothetical protein C8J57DRAFT_1585905 [Mycena rebaudengoi]|nr:hypothetical protein C8J57DRAFT_1585905 [Mycena rebaudengoi]